jgi:prepilin-type N-terminal cleavage/methylation domain-containing protein
VHEQRGFTLVELLIVVAVLSIAALVTFPSLDRAFAEHRMRLSATEAMRVMLLARSYAARHSAHVAVKFHRGADGRPCFWVLYVDGDGDGVLTRDLERGIDHPVPAVSGLIERPLSFASGVVPGFPPGPLPRDPGGRPLDRDRPVRFGRGDLASFGALGTATPGTLYLTDGRRLAAVRVTGRSGGVRVLLWDADAGSWR